jgi:protein-tyrosine phosphatase
MFAPNPNWVVLEGAVNTRDVGGLTTGDGRTVRSGALIRSANLQHLTEQDVARLVGELGVRRIVDLRTDLEVDSEGPGPMHEESDVTIHHLSLYPDTPADGWPDGRTGQARPRIEAAHPRLEPARPSLGAPPSVVDPGAAETAYETVAEEGAADATAADGETAGGAGAVAGDAVPALPWHRDFATDRSPTVRSYLRYLDGRPDSIVAALRAIAEPDGATVVHCAAGKDRTGMVVALALSVVGVPRTEVAADYAATESQLAAIISHLARSQLYAREVANPQSIPIPTAEVMSEVLELVDAQHGGVLAWLSVHGWTDTDTERLRAKLVD